MSSESAGYVTMSGVARVDLGTRELVSRILGVCGKDASRVAAVLARGSLVSGDARYRWVPVVASAEDVARLLEEFPDHDPDRVFDARLCDRMAFVGLGGGFEIEREAGLQRRLLRKRVFWDEAIEEIGSLGPRCERYSYADDADVFVAELTPIACDRLRALGKLLRYSSLAGQVRCLGPGRVTLYARRE